MITDEVCSKCKKTFKYDDMDDKANNTIIPKKIRKVVNDGKNSFPLYAFPPDKRKLVDPKRISFECNNCYVPVE